MEDRLSSRVDESSEHEQRLHLAVIVLAALKGTLASMYLEDHERFS